VRDRRPAPPPGARAVASVAAVVLGVGVLAVPSVERAGQRPVPTARPAILALPLVPPAPAAARVLEPAVEAAPVPAPAEPAPPLAEPVPVEPTAEPVVPEPVASSPAPVPAAPLRPGPPPAPDSEARARAALDALDYPWQELGYRIRFEAHPGGSTAGLTDPATRTITVYVRPTQSDLSLRATIAHEIGHAVDIVTGSDAQRAAYLERRGLPADTEWFPCDRCDDLESGAGDWAEVFAYWLVGPGDFRSRLAGPPSDEVLARLVPLFRPPSARPAASPSPSPSPKPSTSPRPGLLSDSRP
jgi:hypothetical protein